MQKNTIKEPRRWISLYLHRTDSQSLLEIQLEKIWCLSKYLSYWLQFIASSWWARVVLSTLDRRLLASHFYVSVCHMVHLLVLHTSWEADLQVCIRFCHFCLLVLELMIASWSRQHSTKQTQGIQSRKEWNMEWFMLVHQSLLLLRLMPLLSSWVVLLH